MPMGTDYGERTLEAALVDLHSVALPDRSRSSIVGSKRLQLLPQRPNSRRRPSCPSADSSCALRGRPVERD
jgi:hypothetical protein